MKTAITHPMEKPWTHCFECKSEFTEENVFTLNGRKETQISGMCERCFDALFSDDESPATGGKAEGRESL